MTFKERHTRKLSRKTETVSRCKQKDIRLNAVKIQTEIKRHHLTAELLKADPEKVRAVELMPPPTNVKAVLRLIGMGNYLTKFCPYLPDNAGC